MASLKVDLCSAMHAMLPVKGFGFNHSASLISTNLSFGKNVPTKLPCLSLRNQEKQNSNYNHNVLRTSARRPTKLNALLTHLDVGDTREVPSVADTTYQTTVVSIETLVGPKGGLGEVCHIVLNHNGNFSFTEGQFLEVHFGSNKTAFSIASCSGGDSFNGETLSLCVRRGSLLQTNISNYLCNVKAGDTVVISGPVNGKLVFPKLEANHIMVATATGIAPFRSHIQRLFVFMKASASFNKSVWLISGADNYNSLLYDKEFTQIQPIYIDHFRYERALDNSVANSIYNSGNEIFALLDAGAYIYFAGSGTMMPGVLKTFERIAEENGVIWQDMKNRLISNGQWRVEAY